jgi:hypothetical protein
MLQVPRLTAGRLGGLTDSAYILIEYIQPWTVWRSLWGSNSGADRWQQMAISPTSQLTADA